MLVFTERKKRLSRDGTFKAEQNCTRADPDALNATVLRVVIACTKVLLKIALRIGEISLRFW